VLSAAAGAALCSNRLKKKSISEPLHNPHNPTAKKKRQACTVLIVGRPSALLSVAAGAALSSNRLKKTY